MKKLVSTTLLLLYAASYSQTYKINQGDEVKMKKNTQDMDIVAADNFYVKLIVNKKQEIQNTVLGNHRRQLRLNIVAITDLLFFLFCVKRKKNHSCTSGQ